MADVERKLAAILSADGVVYRQLMAKAEVATVRLLTGDHEVVSMLMREPRRPGTRRCRASDGAWRAWE